MSAALTIREKLINELPQWVGDLREPAKVIAFKIGATPRCVQGLRQSEHCARADVLLALGKRYPAIRQKIMELMDAETGESGDDPARVLSTIARLARDYAK